MRNTLAAIAHWLESDEGAYPGNAAQLLRGVLADLEAAPAPQWMPSLPDPALAETLRQLRAKNETLTGQLAEKARAIEGMRADIERLGEDLRVVREHRDTLSAVVERLTAEIAALKAAPPEPAPANDTLPCADGDTAAPVDDERDDPAPAADDGPHHDVALKPEAKVFVPPEASRSLKPAGHVPELTIPRGKLIAVDIKTRLVATHQGIYKVDGMPLARALHALSRIEADQVLGFQQLAKIAGWKDAESAKTALTFEAARLKQRGVEVWSDKFNVRLRVAG